MPQPDVGQPAEPEIGREQKLKAALSECFVALGHVGVKQHFEDSMQRDGAAFRAIVQIETQIPGGIKGACQRAFEHAQRVLLETAP